MSTGSGAPAACAPPDGREGRPPVAAAAAALAVCAVVLVAALQFLFFVVPRTHVRAAKPSAELADRLALWRLADRLPGDGLAGGRLLAALAAAVVAAFAAYVVALVAARRLGAGRPALALAVGVSALEIIVVLVQAYVFTLLTAVFIGMAIHVHH